MSFPRYPKYKDSGVEWLGDVPEHWEIIPLRGYASSERNSFVDGDWIESPYITDEGIRLIQTGNIGVGHYREQGFRFVSEETFQNLMCTEVLPGDVLICRLADPVGRACLAPRLGCRMITSVDVCILKPRPDIDSRYLVFLSSSAPYLGFMEGQCRGGTRDRVSRSFLGSVRTPNPPPAEQSAIARFLAIETSKIDALVAEQRRLIELLKEKRQAVISHAVTKGLNPNAPMKPSGIQWLGDVPEHWRVVPLKWASRCCSGDGLSSNDVEQSDDANSAVGVIGGNGLMGFTRVGNIEHDVLAVGRVGALCGNVHLVSPPAWITDNALVLTPDTAMFDLKFLAAVLRVRNLNDIASKTAQPLITGTQLADQRVPTPSVGEQHEIVAFLHPETEKLDTLTSEAERAIELLQERRTALISAAVTGKIDVRNFVESN